MTRLAIIIALLVAVAGAGVWVGLRWDNADDQQKKSDTLERANDADTSNGDPVVDDLWVRDFLDGLRAKD